MGSGLLMWWIALPIVAFLDLLDLGIIEIGAGLGEVLDLVSIGISFLTVGPIALGGAIEFSSLIPGLPSIEIVPFHTIILILGLMMAR